MKTRTYFEMLEIQAVLLTWGNLSKTDYKNRARKRGFHRGNGLFTKSSSKMPVEGVCYLLKRFFLFFMVCWCHCCGFRPLEKYLCFLLEGIQSNNQPWPGSWCLCRHWKVWNNEGSSLRVSLKAIMCIAHTSLLIIN